MLIYKITSPNGKIYIGQTSKSLEERKASHFKDYKRERSKCPLYDDMIKYGFQSFKFESIQENIENQNNLDEFERYWINFYDSCNSEKGYNQDSGGKSGNTKSPKTKGKISDSSKERWKNPETALKMLKGLQKGTETAKRNSSNNFVKCVCEYCGKEFYIKPYEAKNRKYCSIQCLDSYNKESGLMKYISQKSSIKAHQNNLDNKKKIRETILNWCIENKNVVMSCPKNKIAKTLSGLFNMLYETYGLKDKRSYYVCFNVTSLKDFLEALQNSI